jgi:hypothetical protein
MSRSLYDIAVSALDDLYEMQIAFSQLETLLSVLAVKFPAGSDLREFTDFALIVNKDWADKAAQCADCMDDELGAFPDEAVAHYERLRRLQAKRAGGAV